MKKKNLTSDVGTEDEMLRFASEIVAVGVEIALVVVATLVVVTLGVLETEDAVPLKTRVKVAGVTWIGQDKGFDVTLQGQTRVLVTCALKIKLP